MFKKASKNLKKRCLVNKHRFFRGPPKGRLRNAKKTSSAPDSLFYVSKRVCKRVKTEKNGKKKLRTYVFTRKKRRPVMPRIALGPFLQGKRRVRKKTYAKNDAPETSSAPNPIFYTGKRVCKREKTHVCTAHLRFHSQKTTGRYASHSFGASRMHFYVFFMLHTRFDT